jgi:hypothetical protein
MEKLLPSGHTDNKPRWMGGQPVNRKQCTLHNLKAYLAAQRPVTMVTKLREFCLLGDFFLWVVLLKKNVYVCSPIFWATIFHGKIYTYINFDKNGFGAIFSETHLVTLPVTQVKSSQTTLEKPEKLFQR